MADNASPDRWEHESAGQFSGQSQTGGATVSKADQAIVNEIRENLKLAESAESEQRREEEQVLEFDALDMWEQGDRDARQNPGTTHVGETDVDIPPRPALSFPLHEQPVQQVLNEGRQAALGITIAPKSGLATHKMAQYYRGVVRSIQVESGAQAVRMWALERAVKAGRGYYRIRTDFANDGDFDLDVLLERILAQENVYFDPSSVQADRRDADWACIVTWVTQEERTRRWPKKQLFPDAAVFQTRTDEWYQLDPHTNRRSYLIAEYYRVEYKPRTLIYHPQWGHKWASDLSPEQLREVMRLRDEPGSKVMVRDAPLRRLVRYFSDGMQVLERIDELGRYIPIVSVTGKEFYVRGRRMWRGMLKGALDALRAYNVSISSAVETVGRAPRNPYIMAEGQDAGYEEMWNNAAVVGYSRLYYRVVELGGKPVPPPQRVPTEPEIQGALLLARSMKDDIGSLTGIVDPAFRAVNPYDRSGRAIEALQRQGAAGTSNYLDNLATISMPYEGRIYVDLIPHVYDRPGRILQVIDDDSDDETAIMVRRPFVYGEDGQPIGVPCPACAGSGKVTQRGTQPSMMGRAFPWLAPLEERECPTCEGSGYATEATMPEMWGPEGREKPVQYVDFAKGEYKVSVSIGKPRESDQAEARDALMEMVRAAPQVFAAGADLVVKSLNFPGSEQLAERLKRAIPEANIPEELEDLPPTFVAQLQQLQAQHQEAMETIQKLQQVIQTDQVKAENQKELALIKGQVERQLEMIRQQGKQMAEMQDTAGAKELEGVKGRIEAMQQEAEHRHEVLLELLKQKGDLRAAERAAQQQPSTASESDTTET